MPETTPAPPNTDLRSAIKTALNRSSAENTSGTPDHILADYILACLDAFDQAQTARAAWRGESVELPALSESPDPERALADQRNRCADALVAACVMSAMPGATSACADCEAAAEIVRNAL